ncbi:hypothetical protein [Muricauda sp. MAR_2010_75]|uniref:hypothetical protein n=1 Tax=Allomuricauda sp. MAR_2010_75 TaxID=1250232 RepID=UPI0012E01897|nr:hypothetical protein [Muricauda sp. MAR_2010_75]
MDSVIVDKKVFNKMMASQRQDVRKAILSKSEAIEILGLSEKEFYREKNSPESKIIPSKKQGKFIFSSVILEFERIHGVPYKDAVV